MALLISVPVQFNYNSRLGPDARGRKHCLNLQPVVPASISDDWNMTSRTILLVVSQANTIPGSGSQHGMGDITQSLFFSLKKSTASDSLLGGKQWRGGPTALAHRSMAGMSDEADWVDGTNPVPDPF